MKSRSRATRKMIFRIRPNDKNMTKYDKKAEYKKMAVKKGRIRA